MIGSSLLSFCAMIVIWLVHLDLDVLVMGFFFFTFFFFNSVNDMDCGK